MLMRVVFVVLVVLLIWLCFPHAQKPASISLAQLHIPRTGGTHLSAHIMYELQARHYYRCSRFSKPGDCEATNTFDSGIRAITRLVGWECDNHHSNLTQLRVCINEKIPLQHYHRIVWVTMLRDPIQRLNSVYAKCIQNRLCWDTFTYADLESTPLNFIVNKTRYFSFTEWLNHPNVQKHIRPGRTYACALVPNCDDPKYDDEKLLVIADLCLGGVQFDFIGITDYHDESMQQLARLFGLSNLVEPDILKARESTPSYLTLELISMIEKISAVDIAIYKQVLHSYKNSHQI